MESSNILLIRGLNYDPKYMEMAQRMSIIKHVKQTKLLQSKSKQSRMVRVAINFGENK